jgi:hypothetical protein
MELVEKKMVTPHSSREIVLIVQQQRAACVSKLKYINMISMKEGDDG